MEAKKVQPTPAIFDKNHHDLPMMVRVGMMKKRIQNEDVSWEEALRRAELVLDQKEMLEKQAAICSPSVQKQVQDLLEEARLEKLFRDTMF